MIRAIAIDDEPKALSIIKSHASRVSLLKLEAVFTNPFLGIKYINEHQPDLIFLDINMPDISGLDLLKNLTRKPALIFTTAHSEYAVASYEVEAIDYLLKPFDYTRFLLAVTKVKERITTTPKTPKSFFFVNTGTQKQRIFYKDIYYIKGEGNYVNYFTKNGKVLVRSSIKKTLALLPSTMFVQIHRSYIVGLKWIKNIKDHHVCTNNRILPISATYREDFLQMIEQF